MRNIRRIISIFLCVALCCGAFSTIAQAKTPKKYVKSVSVKKKATITIPFDKAKVKKKYKVTVKTKGKVSKKFTAKSNKKSVATVKVSGKKIVVTAKKAGKVKITIKTKAKGKNNKTLKKVLTLKVKKQKTKAKLATNFMDLFHSDYVDSKKVSDGHHIVSDYIENTSKKAKYTAEVVDKTVVDVYNDASGKQNIYSKKAGKTKAKIYEKAGSSAKKYLGTLTIEVAHDDMGAAASGMFSDIEFEGFLNLFIKTHLGKPTYDLGAQIRDFLVDNKQFGSKFKASDFTVEYSVEEGGEYFNLSDQGVLSGIKNGTGQITSNIKFIDGSDYDMDSEVHVFGYAIKNVPGYSLDTIRNYVIGINTQYQVEDGSMQPQIAFNNAATTPELQYVRDTIDEEMQQYAAVERSDSQKSAHTTAVYNFTRDKVIEFVNADPEKHTCFFATSTTDGLNKLASALITSKNDVVLATRMEHHANDLSWRERCKTIYAEVDSKGRVIYSDLERLLKANKVKLVTVTAASNVTGYVTDVHRVAKLAHKYGAKIVVDGAQIVAHRKFSMVGDINDPTDDIDFFAFSSHKMYAPEGGGAVVGLTSELNKHRPTFYGGGTIKIVGDNWVSWKEAPEVYEPGSPNYQGVVGMGAAIDVLSTIGLDNVEAHEKILNRKIIDGLKPLSQVIIYGDTENIDDKVGVVTFNFHDINTSYIAQKLAEIRAIDTRRDAFCAHPYVWRLMGIDDETAQGFVTCSSPNTAGMVRVSFGIYNTEEEVDTFLSVMPEVMEKARKLTQENPVEPEY